MKRKICCILRLALLLAMVGVIVSMLGCTPTRRDSQEEQAGASTATPNQSGDGEPVVKYSFELRMELLSMARDDQQIRVAIAQQWKKAGQGDQELHEQMVEIDARNTNRMREIVEQYGWPGKNLVLADGANAAWLLVQHADHDVEFQKQCLELLTQAAQEGEADWDHVAYLTDRVLVAEGKEQLYGTQIYGFSDEGVPVPDPIEDEANVDQRRASVGLGPLEEYLESMRNL